MAPIAPVGLRPPSATAAQDRAAIEAVERERVRAFNARDADAIARLYVPGDTVIFHVIPPLAYDLASFRDDFGVLWARFDQPPVMGLQNLTVVTSSGDMAYVHVIVTITGRKDSGHVVDLETRVTDVMRNVGNRWLIEHEHWSLPTDPESGRVFLNSRQPQR